jgi:CubicO group peptidase (beta-lactamase class C family)
MTRIIRTATIMLVVMCSPAAVGAESWPGEAWEEAAPEDVGMNSAPLMEARDYALTGGGSGIVTRHGKLVLAWGDQQQKYDLKSSTKSIGATALGLAIGDGKLKLEDKAVQHHSDFGVPPPENERWRDEITLLHLATQTAGFAKPGGYEKLLFAPGAQWHYSDGGPNWLAECVTLAYRRDVQELMFERVFQPLGITRDDLSWRNNSYRPHTIDGIPRREFGSGVHANVNAMARIALLHLRHGRWRDKQIIPADYIAIARQPVKSVIGLPEWAGDPHGNASDHYGLLWWNNADGSLKDVPRDAFWSWGLYDSLMIVVPSLDLAAARAGKSWERKSEEHYDVLAPFLGPLCDAIKADQNGNAETEDAPANDGNQPPYPPSTVIRKLQWAPVSTIVRQAKGSDNWPTTWGDDDALYTAYGDGNGFEPRTKEKLSLGVARITGTADEFRAENLQSETVDQKGDGAKGKKASGMLMVRGVLYMWVRNAGNAQLAWSPDYGQSWRWSQCRFTESFGFPTFLNFGKNYEGARDEFVYVYSHDHDSAYEPADGIVLARVPQKRILEQDAYQFFAGLNDREEAQWSSDVERRAAVFKHPGRCYRVSVSYNAGLKRYLLRHTHPEGDPRFAGGFSVYDAPEPWGPWTTVFYADEWDVGPGETGAFPTKWMSADGREITMVFSGDDCFSVRKAKLEVR